MFSWVKVRQDFAMVTFAFPGPATCVCVGRDTPGVRPGSGKREWERNLD